VLQCFVAVCCSVKQCRKRGECAMSCRPVESIQVGIYISHMYMCVAVCCCSVLQRVTVCCRVFQHILHKCVCVAECCGSVLQHVAACCSGGCAERCGEFWTVHSCIPISYIHLCVAVCCCSVLQCIAACCMWTCTSS